VKTTPDPQMGLEVLEHLRGLEARGSPGLAAQVIEIFVRDTSTRLAALREAIAGRDGDATYRVAHTLQGSAAMVGAASLASTCGELTSAARSGSFDRCEALVAELDTSFQAIQHVVVG
jgi:HPt (histidine-containing phosphotransfer) domain-containing protein